MLSVNVDPGLITAQVQGTRRVPYDLQIAIRPLSAAQWERVFDALTEQALFSAQLLAGEMPYEIEEAFAATGVSLFPARIEIEMQCSCPDWVVPCKHLAAVYYLLGEEFDRDPFLLFKVRGRGREQVMDALRARRAAGTEPGDQGGLLEEQAEEQATPLERDLTNYWQQGEGIGDFQGHGCPSARRNGPPQADGSTALHEPPAGLYRYPIAGLWCRHPTSVGVRLRQRGGRAPFAKSPVLRDAGDP